MSTRQKGFSISQDRTVLVVRQLRHMVKQGDIAGYKFADNGEYFVTLNNGHIVKMSAEEIFAFNLGYLCCLQNRKMNVSKSMEIAYSFMRMER